jgi:membrane protease YdiL (CAAX protease family)
MARHRLTAAAFGEEMFFRGYLITRLQLVFRAAGLGFVLAIAVPALIFDTGISIIRAGAAR